MTPVTISGMVAGGLLILTTIAIFWTKKEFPGGGVAVTLVGLVCGRQPLAGSAGRPRPDYRTQASAGAVVSWP